MKKLKSNTSLGSILVILSSVFYASYGIWTKLMGDFFGGYTASALRSLLVLIILIPIALLTNNLKSFNFRNNWKKLLVMIFISGFIWGLFYYSVLEAGIGLSLTINYAAITIGMLFFGWLFASESFTSEKRWSAALGILGLFLVYIPSMSGSVSAMALIAALISGLAVAANTVIAKQLPYNTTQSAIALWGTSVIANIPMMFVLKEPVPKIGLYSEWLYLILFAIASLLASWLLLRAMKYIEAGVAGVLGLLEIVFGIVFGIAFFDESIEKVAFLGVMLILLAAALPYLIGRYRKEIK